MRRDRFDEDQLKVGAQQCAGDTRRRRLVKRKLHVGIAVQHAFALCVCLVNAVSLVDTVCASISHGQQVPLLCCAGVVQVLRRSGQSRAQTHNRTRHIPK